MLVILALAIGRRAWLARARVLLAALSALALLAADPDRRIATHNVERWETTGRIDPAYLSRLSPAVPALLHLPPRLREQALGPQRARLAAEPDRLAGANRARARARACDVLAAAAP